jgi:hypothetical protein
MEEETQLQGQLKLILLKERQEFLLGTVTQLDEEPSLLIENCYAVTGDETIEVFPPYTTQRDLFLTSESIFTILDPSPKLVEIYEKA